MNKEKNNIPPPGNAEQQDAQVDFGPNPAGEYTPETMVPENRLTERANSLEENSVMAVEPTRQTGIVSTPPRVGQFNQTLPRRPTGPQTALGKQRSKFNALKHGIFSQATILKGESRSQYKSLLDGLWDAFQPETKLEEILVEKLCSILWRYWRLLNAEGAAILNGTEFLQLDRRSQQQEEADTTISFLSLAPYGQNLGLISKIQNPIILEHCFDLLADLREGIEADGVDSMRDHQLFQKLYGDGGQSRYTLPYRYSMWLRTSLVPEEERQLEGYATPEECKQQILREIDREIRRLKRFQKARASIESERTRLQLPLHSVPCLTELDRLLRYEASLERAFDRTLSQLERLQRIRRGEPVAPRIDVSLST